MDRHVPRWSEFKPLLRLAPRRGSRLDRRLAAAVTIGDLRRLGKRRTPRAVFDYVDGAAGDEISARRAVDAFGRVEFRPWILRDVSSVDTSTTILGMASTSPVVFAPTGYTRMMHADGEAAVARMASRAGIPYTLSTMGTTSPEDLAAASGSGRRWFQLYIWNDRERSLNLVNRAAANGFDVLMLTVDVPVGGQRRRDVRNGLTIPPTLTWQTFVNGALHPAWLYDFLTTPPPTFATVTDGESMPMQYVAGRMFDPSVTFDDLAWFRSSWPGKLIVKGVQSVDDARRLADAGVDGVVLSNHGGRQLDRATTPLELLPHVAEAIGDQVEVMLDSGVRSGADVAAAVALGARAVLVGRAYLYGLMAGGEQGVQRAYDIIDEDLRRTMQLLGATSIPGLTPDLAFVRRT